MKLLRPLSLLFSLILFYSSYGQDHRVSIGLKAWEGVETIATSKGIIVKLTTPLLIGKKTKVPLQFYSPEGKLIWEREIQHGYKSGRNNETMLMSSDESTFLNVERHGTRFNNDVHYFTRISRDGTVKTFEVEAREEFGEELQTIFCDNQYLYYLATEPGKGKEDEKLLLTRFAFADFSSKSFVLDVPAITDDKHTSFWSFVGQKGDKKFLVSKTHDTDEGINRHDIVAFDAEGQITSKISINYEIENFVRPAYDIRRTGPDIEMTGNPDFNTLTYTTRQAAGSPGGVPTASQS